MGDAMPAKLRVTATTLNVREAPSITAKPVGFLHQDDTVSEISRSGDGYWIKVKKAALEGWASHKYLAPVVEVTAADETFPWMPIALAEVGIKEFPGAGDNPRIVEYLRSTNLAASHASQDETHWCSGFVNWCVERAGMEGTDSAWARSWLNWGKKLATPKRGCITVFKRGADSGHVAFYIGETATKIKVLGGNQSDAVSISEYKKSDFLGYRVPG
jgi:uncharacterized protein (TIGR02594 family)